MTITEWLPFLNSGGVLALLVIIVVGGSKGWWVYGWQFKAKSAESDQWRQLAMGSIDTIKQTLEVIEPAVKQLAKRR